MYLFFKRAFDVFIALLTILILMPVFLIVSIVIKSESPGPIIYRGKRSAKNKGFFYIYKFRTMVVDAEKKGGYSTAIDDPRFTRIGRFFRKYKIDELPQFINIIIGDMSLVGPRPQVAFYTDQYIGEEKKILSVRPGITDLASIYFSDMDDVLGSGDVDEKYYKEIEPLKNKLRLKYVQEMCFSLDLKILIVTFLKIIGMKHSGFLDKEMYNL